MKRYIYIIIGIVVLAGIAIAALFLIKNYSGNAANGTTGAATTTGSLPAAGTQGAGTTSAQTGSGVGTLGLAPTSGSSTPTAAGQTTAQNFGVLSSDPVLDYFINPQNDITAIQPTGAVIAIANGQTTTVNSSTINGVISASFSYDGQKIVVSYGDPTDPQGAVFNVTTNAWTALPQGILSPQWSPVNNYQIAYLAVTSAGKMTLATIDAANLKAKPAVLLTLNANDLTLRWATKSEFILSDKPTLQSAGSIWAFNSSAGTLSPLVYEVPGAEGIWSSNASIPYGLVFLGGSAGQSNALQLQAISGSLPTQTFSILTLPSKCAFNTELMPAATSTAAAAGTTTSTATSTGATKKAPIATPTSTPYLALYCGVPRSSSGFSSARLPDDYNTMALFTSDDLYKINTATGAEQVLWSDTTQNMDVSDLKFFNNAIFFVNRYDNKLYGLTFAS